MTEKPTYLTAAEDAFMADANAETTATLDEARADAKVDGYDPQPLPSEWTH